MERTLYKRKPDGTESEERYTGRKHPVSAEEVRNWLTKYDFEILSTFGDRKASSYSPDSNRAIFWARKSKS